MIHQVVPTLHKQLGGVDVAVRELCVALETSGTRLLVHSLTPPPPSGGPEGVRVSPRLRGTPARLGWSPRLMRELRASVQAGDVVHNHSLWMMPNLYAWRVAEARACPLVISPHGTLSQWSRQRSRHLKRLIGWLGQDRALQTAACFHVTAETELADLRELGYRQPVAVIPNGVEVPLIATKTAGGDGLQVLFLSRLHPIKGLDLLLKVWQGVESRHPGAALVVAGPDEGGYGTSMQQLAAHLGLRSVRFVGPLVGAAKQRAFADADVYVLPTHSENFGLTVAEALAAGTPAITTTGAPWQGLVEHQCGWWIERGEYELAQALDEAQRLGPASLATMGLRGRAWVATEFSWPSVAEQMNQLYAWLQQRGDRPAFVV